MCLCVSCFFFFYSSLCLQQSFAGTNWPLPYRDKQPGLIQFYPEEMTEPWLLMALTRSRGGRPLLSLAIVPPEAAEMAEMKGERTATTIPACSCNTT